MGVRIGDVPQGITLQLHSADTERIGPFGVGVKPQAIEPVVEFSWGHGR